MKIGLRLFLLSGILIFLKDSVLSQENVYRIKRTSISPKVDGKMQDEIWGAVDIAGNFIQTLPNPGKESAYPTEVRMCYNNTSVYIFAKLFQDRRSRRKQLVARDEIGRANADYFSVIFDTYHDKQNGLAFTVTSSGVQQDEKLINGGSEFGGEVSWDAVWKSKVYHAEDFWTVEMEIPFSALRISKDKIQEWGLQFVRLVREKNETSYWNQYDVNKSGFLAQEGIMHGVEIEKMPVRLAFYPYLSGGFQSIPDGKGRNKQFLKSGGADIKYGINQSFTLDMTLVPDFSQVISDNLIRNISPFEQQLTENRPFFTEGMELFNKSGLVYSRRIGARPGKYYSVPDNFSDTARYEIQKNPNITPLYNSFKISGRNKNKLGIGVFNSVAKEVHAKIYDKELDETFSYKTEELTNYNVFVLDQALKGQSYLNFTNTNVVRRGNSVDANVSGLKYKWLDKKEDHVMNLSLYHSYRTDKKSGTAFFGEIAKIAKKLRWGQGIFFYSPNYDQTDLGIQFDYNHLLFFSSINYNENKPRSPLLQLYRYRFSNAIQFNSIPTLFKKWQMNASVFLLKKNWWDVSLELEATPRDYIDFYQLRSWDKRIRNLAYIYLSIYGSTDSRRKLFYSYYWGAGTNYRSVVFHYYIMENVLRYRWNDFLETSLGHTLKRDHANVGFAYYESLLEEPIVAYRHFHEQSLFFTFTLNLNPEMSLNGRFRHYHSRILNQSYHRTDAYGNWQSNKWNGVNGNDENFNLQNIDIFFNWIYAPGSRMVMSYKQWLNDAYILNTDRSSFMNNTTQIIKKPKAFEIALRFIYYLDYAVWRNRLGGRKSG